VKAIGASLINLSIMSERREGASSGDRISSRTFILPACGAFVIHERTDEVLALFREDQEIVCYSDVEELVAKVDHYLLDPEARERIARQGMAVVRASHSWDHRIQDILTHHDRYATMHAGSDR
jgi:spore maturation protein CgeB